LFLNLKQVKSYFISIIINKQILSSLIANQGSSRRLFNWIFLKTINPGSTMLVKKL